MDEESAKPTELPSQVRGQLERLLSQLSGVQELATQLFTARQGFYEKLILLNGATLTLLFTVLSGLSHSGITRDALN
jgi:hypothetical protein